MVYECPFFLWHLQYPSCYILRYSELLSDLMERVLNQWQHSASRWRHWQKGMHGLCRGMSSGTCILLICTVPSLLWSVSTRSPVYFAIAGNKYHVNTDVNCLVPPGIVATQWSSGTYPLLFLSMNVARGEIMSCSDILSFPSFQTHSGCSGFLLTSQGWTSAFNRLESIWMSLRKGPMEADACFIHFTAPSGNVISRTLLLMLDESTPS